MEAEKLIQECFDRLESTVEGLSIPAGVIRDRFASLEISCIDRNIQVFVSAALKAEIAYYESFLQDFTAEEIENEVAEKSISLLFCTAVLRLIGTNATSANVKRQHWVPYCVVLRFANKVIKKSSGKNRGMPHLLKFASNDDGTISETTKTDEAFIHKPVIRKEWETVSTFYHWTLEGLFMVWENKYGELMRRLADSKNTISGMDVAVAYIFGLLLEIRKPDSRGHFNVVTIPELINSLCNIAGMINPSFIKIVTKVDHSLFSAETCAKVFTTSDNVSSMTLSLAKDISVVVADHKVSQDEAERIVRRHRTKLVHNMTKGGPALFGFSLEPLNHRF